MNSAIIVGASGMVGGLILDRCLSSEQIATVTIIVRKSIDKNHPKLKQIVLSDLSDYSSVEAEFERQDMGFFCIGAYTGQVADDILKKVTIDLPVAFAQTLKERSSHARLCFLSGAGADRTEKSKTSFARYKGMAERLRRGWVTGILSVLVTSIQSKKEKSPISFTASLESCTL